MEVNATPGAEETPEETAARTKATVDAWVTSIAPMKEWKAYESLKRAEATAVCFPHPTKGTQRYELGGGFKLKLVYGQTYTLGDKDLIDPVLNEKVSIDTQVQGLEEAIQALGPIAAVYCERLIKWKPELSATEFEKLDFNDPIQAGIKELIESILIIKPASPQLTYEEPKNV